MRESAIKIQSYCKMFITRCLFLRIQNLEKLYTSIKWYKKANTVEIITNFTEPQWKIKISLDYCRLRGIFVKYFANPEYEENYEYCFVINGEIKYRTYKLNPNFKPTLKETKRKSISNDRFRVNSELQSMKTTARLEKVKEEWPPKNELVNFPELNKDFEIPVIELYQASEYEDFPSQRADKEILERNIRAIELVLEKSDKGSETPKWPLTLENTPKQLNESEKDSKKENSSVGINFELAYNLEYDNYY